MSAIPIRHTVAGIAVVTGVAMLGAYKLWSWQEHRSPAWPGEVERIEYVSNGDGTSQPAMFYAPPPTASAQASPLLVALHTWSSGHEQADSIVYAKWCISRGWAFVHPHFRGPNDKPSAMGSALVVADILGAVEAARQRTHIDPGRIYLIGESGGGHAALLVAGRAPQLWAGVSAWVAPVDLIAFYNESRTRGLPYADNIARACGGPPLSGTAAEAECRRRSATTYLAAARDIPIDINTGVRDGHDGSGSVSIRHSFTAFNLLADPADRYPEPEIEQMAREATVPAELQFQQRDPLFGAVNVLLRRQSHNVRLTVFDGGHQAIASAGLAWLAQLPRREGAPAN